MNLLCPMQSRARLLPAFSSPLPRRCRLRRDPMSSAHPQQAQQAMLPQLPAELLRIIWGHLEADADEDNIDYRDMPSSLVQWVQHQHALRTTCRQLRDATTPFLTSLKIAFNSEDEPRAPEWTDTLQGALDQLAAFPAAAALTALSWSYVELNEEDAGGREHHVRLPELLPNFFADARERLRGVERVVLRGQLALGYGDLSAVVDACPKLRSLTLERGPLLRRALSPLSRLVGLQALCLQSVEPQAGGGAGAGAGPHGIYDCLRHLTSLTSLQAIDACAEDLLPHVCALPSLLELHVVGYRRNERDAAVFDGLRQLTALTALCFRGSLGSCLALPTQLITLDLPDTALNTAAIRLMASMPRLTDLHVLHMAPDCDLRGLACVFSCLTFRQCPSPLHVTRLPLAGVAHFEIRDTYGRRDVINWCIDASRDLAATCATVRYACELLAAALVRGPAWRRRPCYSRIPLSFELHLEWTRKTRASPSSALLLPAFAPLEGLARQRQFTLVFGKTIDVSCEHVEQLSAHLPSLRQLQVKDASRPGFCSFAAALGPTLPSLTMLTVGDYHTGELPRATQDALLALASFRACAGRLVTLVVGSGMNEDQRKRCNALVRQLQGGAGVAGEQNVFRASRYGAI